MTKRENPRRREREFNKFQERNNKFQDRRDDRKEKNNTSNESMREDLIIGRNAVIEALKSDRTIECVYVSKGDLEGSIKVALGLAKDRGVVIKEADRRKLDTMCDRLNHQGIVARVTPFKYCEVNDILEDAKRKEQQPFIVILDEIEDPHNLGSIIRTAETAGVHGVIIPKRRAVSVNSTVNKVSAGAVEHMKIARVTNISDSIEKLKEAGLWICGTDINTEKYYYNQDLTGPLAIVIGNEGNGLTDEIIATASFNVNIPMSGEVESLNAAVATSILCFEASRQRRM